MRPQEPPVPLTTIGALAFVFAAPALAFALLTRLFDWVVRYERRRPAAAPTTRALADLGADLRRLNGEHEYLLHADVPGKATRLRAVQLAYDDTLLQAARALDVEVPEPPLRPVTRLQTEAELTTHGFRW